MIPEIVEEAAHRFGDRVALVGPDGDEVTYADLDRLSASVAAGLCAEGVSEGDVVAIDLPSSCDYVVAYLAAARLGAIAVGINPRYQAEERAGVLAKAAPKIVIDGDLHQSRSNATVGSLEPDLDRIVTIVFTSGTTGEPKGAVFRNRQLEAIEQFDTGGRWDGGGPMLSSTELCHVGFMTKLPWYLRTGARIHMLRRWRAEDALRTISEQRIASVGGIGAQIALMLRLGNFDDYDVSAVKAIIVGGGPSSPALITEARERFGAPFSVRYSSTESGGVGTLTAFDAPDEETLYTVGRPRDGIDLAIDAPSGEVGEIKLRSPAMMTGYWSDEEATAEAIRDGWLYTKDLGFIDDRGCLRLAGRSKEMFIRGGYNVYPLEVEAVLASHPSVAAVAVVPKPDDVMGETGVAVVVPRGHDAPPTLEDLRSFASDKLAAYKLPESLRIVRDMPLTAMHKIDRRRLEAEVRSS